MPMVFLSYGRNDDEAFVRRLHAALFDRGFRVWWDDATMESRGKSFLHEIRDAIAGRVDRVVVVVGPAAVASDYVTAEWRLAREYGKPITPILRLGDYASLPAELRHYDAVDFRGGRDEQLALDKLGEYLMHPPAPLGPGNLIPPLPQPFDPRSRDFDAIKGPFWSSSACRRL